MTDMNISGIGASAAAKAVEMGTDVLKEVLEESSKDTGTREVSDENEQVEVECNDGADDKNISFGEKLKAFGKGIINDIKGWFGQNPPSMKESAERKLELTEQKQANEKELSDILQQKQELMNEVNEKFTDETEGWGRISKRKLEILEKQKANEENLDTLKRDYEELGKLEGDLQAIETFIHQYSAEGQVHLDDVERGIDDLEAEGSSSSEDEMHPSLSRNDLKIIESYTRDGDFVDIDQLRIIAEELREKIRFLELDIETINAANKNELEDHTDIISDEIKEDNFIDRINSDN